MGLGLLVLCACGFFFVQIWEESLEGEWNLKRKAPDICSDIHTWYWTPWRNQSQPGDNHLLISPLQRSAVVSTQTRRGQIGKQCQQIIESLPPTVRRKPLVLQDLSPCYFHLLWRNPKAFPLYQNRRCCVHTRVRPKYLETFTPLCEISMSNKEFFALVNIFEAGVGALTCRHITGCMSCSQWPKSYGTHTCSQHLYCRLGAPNPCFWNHSPATRTPHPSVSSSKHHLTCVQPSPDNSSHIVRNQTSAPWD